MKRPRDEHIANGDDMTTNAFDTLIRNAAPSVPDPGPSRRHLRTVLHARMWRVERRGVRRHRWGVSLAAVLTFVMVYGVHLPQLGSDDMSLSLEEIDAGFGNGKAYKMVSPLRGAVGGVGEGTSEKDILELYAQRVAGEGIVTGITGYASEGQAGVHWMLLVERNVNGKVIKDSKQPRDTAIPFAPVPRKVAEVFFANHVDEFDDAIAAGRIPARDIGVMAVDGVDFAFKTYTATFPGIGAITFYEGVPVAGPYPFMSQ